MVVGNPSAYSLVGIELLASSVASVAFVASSVVVAYILERTMRVVDNLVECMVVVACILVVHSWLAYILVGMKASWMASASSLALASSLVAVAWAYQTYSN